MGLIELDLEAQGVDQVIRDLQATEGQVRLALASTLRKMASWMRTRSVRGLSDHLQVQQKVLRRRLKSFRLRRSADGASIMVWYGLNPIALVNLGARQTRVGVTAGKHQRPGAFIAQTRNGKRHVFKRAGRARLPIKTQVLDIADRAQTYIEDNVAGDVAFEQQFQKTFEHELRWRMQKQT